ncbi:flavodoxin [Herbidospora mongoliensis]|uniref:flavodoxin n=1 Tax=Herbidospora mongoliensis TaxID=688067 RepID=UPI001FE0B4D7|nr:flavodoxin [Herbidospora mongoliensis]
MTSGLRGRIPTEVMEVGTAPTTLPDDIDLLVVGGPTHAFGMSRASTRKSALDQADNGVVSKGEGVREWLTVLRIRRPIAAAAFDTRVRTLLAGSAAKGVHKALRRHRMVLIAPPMGFYVTATKGPLDEAEVSRAIEWGRSLAETASTV